MIKILLIVLISAGLAYSQTPTPTPILTAEQKAKSVVSKKQRLAAERRLPASLSAPLYAKYESSKRINLFLTSHHAKIDKPALLKIEVCFDLMQFFQSEDDAQNSLIENAVFIINQHKIKFQLPYKIPPLQERFSKNNFSRFWMFRIILSAREVSLLRKSRRVFIKWNNGEFGINKKNLRIAKNFLDEELMVLRSAE